MKNMKLLTVVTSPSIYHVSSLSVREVCLVSGLSSFASFINDLNTGGNEGTCGGRHWYFWIPKLFLSLFVIVSFLVGNLASDFIFILFLGMRFSGVTISLVYPVNMELTDISVQIFSANITSGACASYWVTKFGPLVTFCVLIYYLGHFISPQIGATTFSFAYFLSSLDDAIFLTELLIFKRFNLVESKGTKNVLYGSMSRPSISFS